jgi:crossover junction endodeoxyribonuclease RuvC
VRILGIDPGSHRLGWGIIDSHGSRLTHVASGTLRAVSSQALPQRLHALYDGLEALLLAHRPEVAAIETLYHDKNAQSVFVLAQARGAILLALARAQLGISEYSPGQIKRAATGRGNSDKLQVQAMVQRLLALPAKPAMGADTSDALACALCHAQFAPMSARLQGRVAP